MGQYTNVKPEGSVGASVGSGNLLSGRDGQQLGHLLGYGHSVVTDDLMAATLPAGTRRLPGLGEVEIEAFTLGPLLTSTSVTAQLVTLPGKEPLVRSLPWSIASADDASLLLEPLVTARVQRTSGSRQVNQVRSLEDVLDDETELVEEELLELLARATG